MSIRVLHRRDSRTNCEANTPAEAELWYDTTIMALRLGTGTVLGGLLQKLWGRSYSISPPQLTADQNDYAPADFAIAETVFVSASAARAITGLAGGSADRRLTLANAGAYSITLADASVASAAANRFAFGEDVVLRPGGALELQYSTGDNRWHRASGGLKVAVISEDLLLPGAISPAQITANQNDYAPPGIAAASTLRLSTDAARNLTGLADPRDGAIKAIVNIGANDLVLKTADAASAAANRFDFGTDVTLAGKQSCTVRYDGTDARWKLLASTAGASVAAGGVTANKLAGSAISPRAGMINGKIVESRAANAVTYAIKTLAGTDPTALDPVRAVFQDGAGGYVARDITAALSLTISSGSTLGFTSAEASRLWLVLVDTGAGVVLGAVNCRSGTSIMGLLDGVPYSTTAEGGAGAADSAQVIYTAAAQASKYLCIAGYADYDAGLAAAGAWSAAPSRIVLFSGGVARPGAPTGNRQRVESGAVIGCTTVIPLDDTIPQITEGDQVFSRALQPSSPCNFARARCHIIGTSNVIGTPIAALFRDSIANAIAATLGATVGTANYTTTILVEALSFLGTAAAVTFKVRAGPNNSGQFTLNGIVSTGRFLGGACASYLDIEEIMG